jgi:antitoxin component of MazEF toxin-antitoxin module
MSNRSRVQQLPSGVYVVSIPRALVQALDINKGDLMEWKLEGGKLLLKKARK